MKTIILLVNKPNGESDLSLLNIQDGFTENFEEYVQEVIRGFEESWDRPITNIHEIPEEFLEDYGITFVKEIVLVEAEQDTLFQKFDNDPGAAFSDYMDDLHRKSGIPPDSNDRG